MKRSLGLKVADTLASLLLKTTVQLPWNWNSTELHGLNHSELFTSALSSESDSHSQPTNMYTFRFHHVRVCYVLIHYVNLYVNKKLKRLHKQHIAPLREILLHTLIFNIHSGKLLVDSYIYMIAMFFIHKYSNSLIFKLQMPYSTKTWWLKSLTNLTNNQWFIKFSLVNCLSMFPYLWHPQSIRQSYTCHNFMYVCLIHRNTYWH